MWLCEGIDPDRFGAPFLPGQLESRPGAPTVLIVGKSVNAPWTLCKAAVAEQYEVDERLQMTRSFMSRQLGRDPKVDSSFWAFARRVSDMIIGNSASGKVALIWSNICKLPVYPIRDGLDPNPRGPYSIHQSQLAAESLAVEIEHFQPDLVVIATGSYGWGVIQDARIGTPQRFQKEKPWSREKTDQTPAILWMGHPERKTKDYIDSQLSLARALLAAAAQ